MLKTVHCPTGSACANVRRVSARFRHFALLTKAPQRKRELAASGCCFVCSIRRCSVMISMTAGQGTSRQCYQNGPTFSSCAYPELRAPCRRSHNKVAACELPPTVIELPFAGDSASGLVEAKEDTMRRLTTMGFILSLGINAWAQQ